MGIALDNVKKVELCQISLTGARSLILLGLLITKPMSLEEIKEEFIKLNMMEASNSDDVVRIDINTLRAFGCEISRADHRTNNKYVLLNHPFKLKVTAEEAAVLKRAFNKLKESADISILLQYDRLFKKIADYVSDAEVKEQILGISVLKTFSISIIKDLEHACKNRKTVKLIYKNPTSNKEEEIDIFAEKISMKNNKLYLFGVDKNTSRSIYLNIKRILKIISQNDNEDNTKSTPVIVKFKLKAFGVSGLEEDENILSGDVQEGFVIEGKYHNEFYAIQRILSFGSNCTVIEPQNIKQKIVDVLKKMREIYNG